MPLRLAARKCPDAVFLPVDQEAYDEASAVVMATLRSLEWGGRPVVVEVLGWDEAFLAAGPRPGDQPRPDRLDAPAWAAAGPGAAQPTSRQQQRRWRRGRGASIPTGTGPWVGPTPTRCVRRRTFASGCWRRPRLHCSVGIGDNKLRAKIATEFGKPRGSVDAHRGELVRGDGRRGRPRRCGASGRRPRKKLAALGIDTVDQLAHSDARVLAAELGPTMGPWYHRLGRGVSDSAVSAEPWVPRAHGRETTFQEDLEDWDRIAEEVRTLTRQVRRGHRPEGRPAARVGLKLRYRPFITISRSLTLPEPTNDPDILAEAAVSLLDRVEQDRPVRLLGVRLEMVAPEGGY